MKLTKQKVEHKGEYVSCGWMLDGWKCSCGWESNSFFDGAEYAESEFKRHVAEAGRAALKEMGE